MKLYTFLFIKIILIHVIFLCNGVREICTGPGQSSPCFIYFKPEETFFQRVLSLVDTVLAMQVRKTYLGYKKDPNVLMGANSYILKRFSQPMIRQICMHFPKNLVYKNPTIINLEYHKNTNQVLNNQGNMMQQHKQNWAQRAGIRSMLMLKRGFRGRK
uniref:Uncharacterized protein n=1 Tax=Strongyloides papillosus TaxID=174720 RepID=A0A0N5BCF6_STREA